MILVGIFLAFFGNKFVNGVLFLLGAIVLFAVTIYITFMILESSKVQTSTTTDWIITGGLAVLSLLGGYGFMKIRKFGIGCLGAVGGVFLGLFLTTLITSINESDVIYYLVIIGCGIGAFVITFFVEQTVIIFITSFLGSYGIVRGVSLYAGGFPNETQIHQ